MQTQLLHPTWGWLRTVAGRFLDTLNKHRGEPWVEADLLCERCAR